MFHTGSTPQLPPQLKPSVAPRDAEVRPSTPRGDRRPALVVGSRKSRYNQDRFMSTADALVRTRSYLEIWKLCRYPNQLGTFVDNRRGKAHTLWMVWGASTGSLLRVSLGVFGTGETHFEHR